MTDCKFHKLLTRQLNKCDLQSESAVKDNWQNLLQLVSQSYDDNDMERYLLQRSLSISSDEMQQLQKHIKKNADEKIHRITNAFPDMLIYMNEEGVVMDLLSTSGFEHLLIDYKDQQGGKPIEFILKEDLAAAIRNQLILLQKEPESPISFTYEYNENTFYEVRLLLAANQHINIFCLIRNISDLQKSKNELEYLLRHDPLTKLPNRLFLYHKFREVIDETQSLGLIGGIMFFDLDRFKAVNDSLGHKIGDQLIISVADRISKIVRDNEFFARMSGDEFIIIIKNIYHEYEILDSATRILDAFEKPFILESHQIETKVSIGVSFFPRHSTNPDELIQYADTAMYSAKDAGGNQIKIFNKSQSSIVQKNFKIEQELRRAIENDEVFLVYQPQYDIATGKLSGLESLIRWKPQNKNLIPPDKFLPIAELTGFIDELGIWIIDTACKQISIWKKQKIKFGSVSINLSRNQLIDYNLANIIFRIMRKYKVSYSDIVFEIIEDTSIKNNVTALENLKLLYDAGIHISIDDFGSGYSSFSDLKRFPFSELKIDKSIIEGIGKKSNDDAIVRAIIAMGRELNMRTVAEGV